MKKRVALIMGTRPEVIKLAPVHLAMQAHAGFDPVILSSGQHREMLRQALDVFSLRVDWDLDLMTTNQNLAELTAKVIRETARALEQIKPDCVLVQGDTTTVLGAAISAVYAKIPVGHVEAGLRTYDFEAPWPEEINRRLVDPISTWCFSPTDDSQNNLLSERIPENRIFVTGNTVIDAVLLIVERLKANPGRVHALLQTYYITRKFSRMYLDFEGTDRKSKKLVLVTAHRRESFGARFENICKSILELVETFSDVGVIYPVHLNPKVTEPVRRMLGGHPRIILIDPIDYETFVWLMSQSYFVLTDSGGIQEEAPSLGKPVLVMRDLTERPEGVRAGTSRLVGTNPKRILEECELLLTDKEEYKRRTRLKNPYGDGKSSQRIIDILHTEL